MPEVNSAYLLAQVVRGVIATFPRTRPTQSIIDDLRFLRFDDDGVISLVEAIVEGRTQQIAPLLQRLTDFNEHEWRVAEAAARLIERCSDVSRFTHEELQLIAWRKPRVRADLQQALNAYGQPGKRVNRKRLKEILASIRDLNDAIDETEHALLHGNR
jgi:hypothetical protein